MVESGGMPRRDGDRGGRSHGTTTMLGIVGALALAGSAGCGPSIVPSPGGASPRAAEAAPAAGSAPTPRGTLPFGEDFEAGLERWRMPFGRGHRLVDREDGRGQALELETGGLPVYALIDGSDSWGNVRIEGEMLFPTQEDSYLGFIYRYVDDGRRVDFGSAYVKGNGSYVQANDHADTNVSRTLFPEIRASLDGIRSVRPGTWQRFALEVVGREAHLYVGDLDVPALTLPEGPTSSGAFGFKPRNPGAPVRIDDIRVSAIDAFSWKGSPVPDPGYDRARFATDWSVLGPLTVHLPQVETGPFDPGLRVVDDGRAVAWTPFPADHRGAVLTGRVVEFRRGRRVAYFHTVVEAERAGRATLEISTVDDMALWVNGTFVGFGARQGFAWWDAGANPDRPVLRASAELVEGRNHVVVRVVGGVYASGGFYLRVVPAR